MWIYFASARERARDNFSVNLPPPKHYLPSLVTTPPSSVCGWLRLSSPCPCAQRRLACCAVCMHASTPAAALPLMAASSAHYILHYASFVWRQALTSSRDLLLLLCELRPHSCALLSLAAATACRLTAIRSAFRDAITHSRSPRSRRTSAAYTHSLFGKPLRNSWSLSRVLAPPSRHAD